MKRTLTFLLIFFSITLFSQVKVLKYNPNKYYDYSIQQPDSIFVQKEQRVETAWKGFLYPYMHINGFNGYDISKSSYKKFDDYFELKFFHTYSAYYTRKVMFQKFGNWDSYFFIKRYTTPFLIWENVRLFKNDERKFTVIAGGYECTTCKNKDGRIYASVFVLDENGNDVLNNQDSELAQNILQYFSNGIKNLTNNNEFYAKFWGLIKKKKIKL